MLDDLRRAHAGEVHLSDARLRDVYVELMNWEYARPQDAPGGASWSDVFGVLAEVLAERPHLSDYAVLTEQLHAGALNREGRRTDALAVLDDALEQYSNQPYSIALRLDRGMLLRDEHEFRRALAELTKAAEVIEKVRGRDFGPEYADQLKGYEASVTSELGAAADALGMTDYAEEQVARADELAQSLDDHSGPAVWGGNLVYHLNLAIVRDRKRVIDGVRDRYRTHPWRALLPEETDEQIRVRLAIADVSAAFRDRESSGAGEEELRALLAESLTFSEDFRARVFLGRSLLDRGAIDEAGEVLAEASERLDGEESDEPALAGAATRLHLLGLRSQHLRATGASTADLSDFLASELRPAFAAFLERAARWPLEEAGVSPLLYEGVRGALSELFTLEVATAPDGNGAERAFAWLARLHAIGSFAREQELAVPTLAELRADLIGSGEGVLAYVPGRESSHVFALDGETLAIVRLGRACDLDRAARTLEEAIQAAIGTPGPHADALLDRALAAASEAFVPPEVRAHLARWSGVLVLGLDDFGYVPLEGLRGPGGEPVGVTHAVTYQPSLPVAVWLVRRARALAPATGPAVYYVGDGDPARGGRPELPAFELDPDRLGLRALDRAGVPRIALDPGDAERLPTALAAAPLAAFFLHGVYEGARVLPAGILVVPEEPGGAWFAEEVAALPPCPVALIAACGGDRAPLRRGDDGRGHLRSSFFRSGSVCVATATLALEVEATADLVALVNARLAAGDSVAEAFRAARAAARPEERGVHPVHSSLLHVFGAGGVTPLAPRAEWRAASERRRSGWLPWLAGGAIALLGAYVVSRRWWHHRSPHPDRP